MISVCIKPDFEAWRREARKLLADGVRPEDVYWSLSGADDGGLFDFSESNEMCEQEGRYAEATMPRYRVPKAFFDLAESVVAHRSDEQWGILYQLLWRIACEGERAVLMNQTDNAILKLAKMQKEIRRDMHKMRAFVRFKQFKQGGEECYVAWFEPDHRILRLNVPFFRKRFTGMKWSILTADECAHWDGAQVVFSEGVSKEQVPESEDELESYWLAYYRNIFNPARLKIQMMQSEMPKKYWKNLPEAEIIEELIQGSQEQVVKMIKKHPSVVKLMPEMEYLEDLHRLNSSADDAPG